ncbi:MAG TPA: TlpA disulfide reductase family protein [Candidatus Limnocylindrales bacterium]|jgi:peroxiredoxin|nr:TlpA disulfide reductase family protein [Candidatus Limnocylindrales bacterium]
MRRLVIICAVLLALGVFYWGLRPRKQAGAASLPARVGAVTLTDLSGRQFTISDYKGKVLLVNFWAAWCAPCQEEIPQFAALQTKYGSQGLQVIGISVEDIESELRDFCRKKNVNYPVVPGDAKIADAFGGILGLPTTLLIGRDGRIYKKYAGATDFATLENDFLPFFKAPPQ